jgi:hypothetical protein
MVPNHQPESHSKVKKQKKYRSLQEMGGVLVVEVCGG